MLRNGNFDNKSTTLIVHVTFLYTYTVSQKNIPNFFDCNLKTNYQILIIFGTNISDTTCHQMNI